MTNLQTILLYRMVHIDNISHIKEHGLTHKNSLNHNPNYIPIGDKNLIFKRNKQETIKGKTLNDYIPFYFHFKMPMLYVIQKGFNEVPYIHPENIIYCITNIQKIIESNLPFLFTDGHAVKKEMSNIYTKEEVSKIEKLLDFNAKKAPFWKDENDTDLKRRKEAEFLLEGDLPFSFIIGFAVYNETSKTKLIKMGINEKQIGVRPYFYF